MPGKRIATFLHVSDLHLGEVDPLTLDSVIPALAKWNPEADGMLGHELLALRAIQELFTKLRAEENAKLIVTGDLTAKGHPLEFSAARDFIGGNWHIQGQSLGLSEKDWRDRAVPGNHDHWPGLNTVLGKKTDSFGETFDPPPPRVSDSIEISPTCWLRFIRIDTDSEVGAYSLNRLLARGSFCDQIERVQKLLQLSLAKPRELRVLLLHHSLCHSLYNENKITLRITKSSREALRKFIVNSGISVLLSGHIHSPFLKVFSTGDLGTGVEVLEARCGTSSQRRSYPPTWRTILGIPRKEKRKLTNTVLVHRISEDRDNVYWHSEVLAQTSEGFRGTSSSIDSWEIEAKVLPRVYRF